MSRQSQLHATETRSSEPGDTVLWLRLPRTLAEQLERISNVEGNAKTAIARRLIAIGLRAEAEQRAR